jgi:uncharacterized protein YdeI (YjbR/CyaY-like superfamily)
MRREAGVDVSDTVRIELRYDPKPRMPPMLKALKEALNTNERAKEKWRLQTSSRRKEILMYLNSLRSEESIKRNVDKITRMLFELNTKRKN